MKKDPVRQCLEDLAIVRMYISKEFPYFALNTYALCPHMAAGYGTVGTTAGMGLIIDPEWFSGMGSELNPEQQKAMDVNTLKMQAGVIVHEIGHQMQDLARLAELRAQGVSPKIVNIGADLAWNCVQREMCGDRLLLPDWAHYPEKWGFPPNLTLEQYIELLQAKQKKDKETFDKLSKEAKVGAGQCGSAVGNSADAAADDAADATAGRSEADKERIKRHTLREVQKHMESSAGRGTMPGSLQEMLNNIDAKPMVSWKRILPRVIRKTTGVLVSGGADYSKRKPSKRSWARGILLPSLVERKIEMLVIRDTSGSMGAEQLGHVTVETISACRQLGIEEVWWLDVDAKAYGKPMRVSLRDIPKLPIMGRGGTSFIPGIEVAQKMRPKPDVVIYMTDGDGQATDAAPKGMAWIWCIVPTPYGSVPAPWGKMVVCSDEQSLRDQYAKT